MTKLLHIFTFSPVQSFISASRRLSDLYHSSLLLSTLTEKLIDNIKDKVEIIYPVKVENGQGLANYPNRIVFLADECMCERIKELFKKTWHSIYENVLEAVLKDTHLSQEEKDKLTKQVKLHLENYFKAYCECTSPEEIKKWKEKLKQNLKEDYNDYAVAYDWTERKLGALKSKKPYEPLIDDYVDQENEYPNGCTLCGERAHLAIDWKKFRESSSKEIRHYLKEEEKLCGVCFVKRYAFYYLGKQFFFSVHDVANAKFKEKLKEFESEGQYKDLVEELKSLLQQYLGEKKEKPLWYYNAELFEIKELESIKREEKEFASIIDKLIEKLKQIYNLKLLSEPSQNYFAIIISDGDSIGEWLGLKSKLRKEQEHLTKEFHSKFSNNLSEYAKEIRKLEDGEKFGLRIVYAGGDDVLAVADLRKFLDFAEKLNPIFQNKVGNPASVSAGIVIGHQKDNLAYLLNEVRKAERKAKGMDGKSAFCITVIPRGGAPISFTAKWSFLALFKDTVEYFEKDIIGDKTAYDVREIVSRLEENKGENREIVLALLKRILKRRVDERKVKEYLVKDKKAFIKEYLERLRSFLHTSDNIELCQYKLHKTTLRSSSHALDLQNFANLFYTARFVAKKRR